MPKGAAPALAQAAEVHRLAERGGVGTVLRVP